MRYVKRIIMFVMAVLMLTSAQLPAHAARNENTVVRVGFPIQAGLSYIDDQGNYAGYLVDYLERISWYTGWEYEYVQVEGDIDTQLSTLLDMLSAGEIDMMGTMNRNAALEEMYLYPNESYGTTYTTLAVAADSQQWIEEDFANWDGITVGSYPGFESRMKQLEQYAAVHGFTYYEIEYDTFSQVYDAVLNGEVDATLQVDISLVDGLRSIATFSPTPYYFALYKGNTDLLWQLNEALENLKRSYPHLQSELYTTYFSEQDQFYLSEESREVLQGLGELKVLFCTGNAPLQYWKDGKVTGFAVSYFDNFAEVAGIQYEAVAANNYDEVIARLDSGEIDIIACIPTNSELLSDYNMRLSLPYLTSNNVRVCTSSFREAEDDRHNMAICINAEDSLNSLNDEEKDSVRMDYYSFNYYLRKKRFITMFISIGPMSILFRMPRRCLIKCRKNCLRHSTNMRIHWGIPPVRTCCIAAIQIR